MEPIGPDRRLVANLDGDGWQTFEVDGEPSPGETILQLDRSQPLGVGFHVYRMAPGTETTPHEHTGDEQYLVLDGDLVDHDGFAYGPGDLVLLRRGTRHNSRTMNGCTLAVHIATPEENLSGDA